MSKSLDPTVHQKRLILKSKDIFCGAFRRPREFLKATVSLEDLFHLPYKSYHLTKVYNT